jgi:6-phosphogluconolactonase
MDNGSGAVYVQTNDAARNEVIAFRRYDDGRLEELGRVATGGRGTGKPHLTSQGSVTLSQDGRWLLVADTGSDQVTLLAVTDGGVEPAGQVSSGGSAPQSVAEHAGLVYVLNTGGDANVSGFQIEAGRLVPIEGSTRRLSAPDADPAQAGFSPDGSTLVVTERGTDRIVTFLVEADGTLGDSNVYASSGPTPYGFAFAGDTLFVTEAFGARVGEAAASSYRIRGGELSPRTRSLGNGRSEICWAVTTSDGRYAFTTNFADGAVSRYAIGDDGSIVLEDAAAGTAREGEPGLRDEGLTADGRYLYAIDADSQRVVGWSVGEDGSLTPVGSWDGPPATVAGLAAS